jgi:hypothetical protein
MKKENWKNVYLLIGAVCFGLLITLVVNINALELDPFKIPPNGMTVAKVETSATISTEEGQINKAKVFVIDENNKPVIGAKVVVKWTDKTTTNYCTTREPEGACGLTYRMPKNTWTTRQFRPVGLLLIQVSRETVFLEAKIKVCLGCLSRGD